MYWILHENNKIINEVRYVQSADDLLTQIDTLLKAFLCQSCFLIHFLVFHMIIHGRRQFKQTYFCYFTKQDQQRICRNWRRNSKIKNDTYTILYYTIRKNKHQAAAMIISVHYRWDEITLLIIETFTFCYLLIRKSIKKSLISSRIQFIFALFLDIRTSVRRISGW